MSLAPLVLPDYYLRQASNQPDSVAFWVREETQWVPVRWADFVTQAKALASAFAAAGLGPESCLGIMAPTSLDWEICQFAALYVGAAVVGLDPHDQPERLEAMANTAAIKGVVLGDFAYAEKLNLSRIPSLRFALLLKPEENPPDTSLTWLSFKASCTANVQPPPMRATPEGLATIVFTSGSTGVPKGIGYSHAQVCLALENILNAFPQIDSADRLVCWLPLSNLFQRMLNFCAAGRGAQSFVLSDPREIVHHLPTIRPSVFVAVPRFFEKLNEGITARIEQQPVVLRALAKWALAVGDKIARRRRCGESLNLFHHTRYLLADRLVLQKLRGALGGRIRFMVSGSAPFPLWLLERFDGMGLRVLEAYGLSENVVPIALNKFDDFRLGSVGKALPANLIRLAEDGELLVKGDGVFSGYLGQATPAESFDTDGYLRTGDLARIEDDGFLYLVGRKSEVFKTSTGRKIAPLALEALLTRIAEIDQAMVLGAERKALAAIVTLTPAFADGCATPATLSRLALHLAARIREEFQTQPDYLKIAGLIVARKPFSLEKSELTTNLKLRRKAIESNFCAAVERLYFQLEATHTGFTEIIDEGLVCLAIC